MITKKNKEKIMPKFFVRDNQINDSYIEIINDDVNYIFNYYRFIYLDRHD